MKFAPKIEKAVANDRARPVLAQPWLNVEKGRIEATDSYIAAVVPVELNEGDTSGPIPLDAIAAARKRGNTIECGETARVPGYAAFERPNLGDVKWPDIDGLVPDAERAFTIAIDPKLLLRAAEALGADKVQLDLYHPDRVIVVREDRGQGNASAGFALVMPVAMKNGELPPLVVNIEQKKAA